MRRSRRKPSVWASAAAVLWAGAAAGQGIEASLTGAPGDAARGEAIVAEPTRGLCPLCHDGPFAGDFAGTLGPDLTGVGDRLDEAELRQRIVDSRVYDPDGLMPPYYSMKGLTRVGERWAGATLFTAEEVEDVVAYLVTLKETGG